MWGNIAIAFLVAFTATFVAVPYTIKYANKVGAIDIPNKRKVHNKPIPRIGGLAVIAGFFVSVLYLIVVLLIEQKGFFTEEVIKKIIGFILGAIVIAVFGYIDDVKNLRPRYKLLGQIIAALIAFGFGLRIDAINEFQLGKVFEFILTIGWIVGITNAIDLIDGLDGLSSGTTMISCISLLIIFATNDSPLLSILLVAALSGAIAGFIPYNVYPAKTFIGDVGAQFLGYSIACISILGIAKTVTLAIIIAPVLVLGLPILDTLTAIVRRVKKGKSLKAIFSADKNHIHHKLMRKGYTQKQAVVILYAMSAILGMFAIILIDDGVTKALSFAGVVIVIFFIGRKELKKYRKELIEENIKLGLVEPKQMENADDILISHDEDIENIKNKKTREKEEIQNKGKEKI